MRKERGKIEKWNGGKLIDKRKKANKRMKEEERERETDRQKILGEKEREIKVQKQNGYSLNKTGKRGRQLFKIRKAQNR